MYRLKSEHFNQNIQINTNLTIGRVENNDIVISNSSISSHHAKIYLEDNIVYLEDLESTNGTYIDNYKISPETQYELKDSQEIRFGDISYIIEKLPEDNYINNIEEFIIGRDPKSDIFIDSDTVSFNHIKIIKEDNQWYILDNNSTNGTYLNSYDNRIEKIKLERDDKIFLATYKLNTNEIFELFSDKKSVQNIVNSDITLIGRDPEANMYIDNLNVSWNHAKIIKEDESYYIYDLNSTNGTFVNDAIISKKQKISIGDKITLGVYSFIFEQNNNKDLSFLNISRSGFRIDVKDVSFSVNTGTQDEKILLDKINFTIYPEEMVGLMGLSGAGKTTLLKILSGYTKPTEGKIFINGLDLYKNFDRIKNSIGYVPQDDIIHPELTVYESLFYSIKLRLKEKISTEEINHKIYTILKELGLPVFQEKDHKNDIRSTKIGDANDKGISGGQRKRINIAMELLADPEVIFLDEPTSGLSSVDAKIVMEKLKELSDAGKTILLTIHQPSLINYKKMDDVVILTKGELAYFGPNHPESIKFFNKNTTSQDILNDPDMALLGLDAGEKNNINWRDKYEESDIYNKFVEDRSSKQDNSVEFNKKNSPSNLNQIITLTQRFLNIKIKDKINSAILLIQAPVIAILLAFLFAGEGFVFHEENPSILLFILVISSMWFGIINSVKEIVFEKAIYERERLIGLRLLPYILSKFLVLALLSLLQVIILVIIVNAFVPLNLNLIALTIIIFITSLSGLAIGLLISAISKSVSQALSLVPIILLPMIIFAGGMIPIKDMATNKIYLDAYRVSSLMPTRWSLEEVIRIYDIGEDNNSIALREPIADINNTTKVKYLNKEVLLLSQSGEEALCENRRCVEALYINQNISSEIWTFRTTSTNTIYSILLFFIIFPLGLIMFILRRRDN